jgi:hypothetical protein
MSLKSICQYFNQGSFKIPNEEGVLVFPTEVEDTPLPDIFSNCLSTSREWYYLTSALLRPNALLANVFR